jgi:hypothetical protein
MRFAALALLTSVATANAADMPPIELHGFIDLRGVAVDSSLRSFEHGGLGSLPFDEAHEGVQSGRFVLDAEGSLTDTLRTHVTALATVEDDEQNPIDVTEAFIEWRPYPQSHWRWRTRLGSFYPPVSLENRGVGWQSVYSPSASAVNTWIGEEVRSVGLEVSATSVGATLGRDFDIGAVAGLYGWSDPAGVLLFQRGWALHDRATPLFGGVRRPFRMSDHDRYIESGDEIDGRPGYYGGMEVKWQGRHVLRILHYDNCGDPAQEGYADDAWRTRFDAIGARLALASDLTLIAQAMQGDTAVGPSADGRGMLIADYRAWFLLGSYSLARHRVTIRHDRMHVASTRGAELFDSGQRANAWTVAYIYEHDAHWLAAMEWLRADGSLRQRELVGLPAAATERQLQVVLRYSF